MTFLNTKKTTSHYVVLALVVALAIVGDSSVQSSLGRQWHWLTLVVGLLFIGGFFFAWQWFAARRMRNRQKPERS